MDTLSGFNTKEQDVEDRYQWINEMIKSRQNLVVAYMELLTKLHSNSSFAHSDELKAKITSFCEDIIDYVSHGHFDLYPKIIALIENASGRSLSIAHRVLPKIEKTTDFLMRFNDRYSEASENEDYKSLISDLENVGSFLEQRFKNEDRLIIGLRLVHTIASTPVQSK